LDICSLSLAASPQERIFPEKEFKIVIYVHVFQNEKLNFQRIFLFLFFFSQRIFKKQFSRAGGIAQVGRAPD
jgi:hypothetical protein